MRTQILFSVLSKKMVPFLTTLSTVVVLGAGGCTTYKQPLQVVAASRDPLTAGSQSIVYLDGEYLNCKTHDDGSLWTTRVTASSVPLPVITITPANLPLRVVEHDTDCMLFLKDVVFSDATGTIKTTYYLQPVAQIGDSFLAAPVPFFLPANAEHQFYGNIRIVQPNSLVKYDGDFSMEFVYATSPSQLLVQNGPIGYLNVGTSQVTSSAVLAPDYSHADFSTDAFVIAVNSSNTIVTLNGDLRLTSGAQDGETWVFAPDGIVTALLVPGNPASYGDVEASYIHAVVDNGQPQIATLPGHLMKIQPSQMGFAVGQVVPSTVTKTIIVKHTDGAAPLGVIHGDVISYNVTYEVITVTFMPPPVLTN